MKAKNDERKTPLSPSMVEGGATVAAEKRLKDLGLIVNAGAGKAAKVVFKKKGWKK